MACTWSITPPPNTTTTTHKSRYSSNRLWTWHYWLLTAFGGKKKRKAYTDSRRTVCWCTDSGISDETRVPSSVAAQKLKQIPRRYPLHFLSHIGPSEIFLIKVFQILFNFFSPYSIFFLFIKVKLFFFLNFTLQVCSTGFFFWFFFFL